MTDRFMIFMGFAIFQVVLFLLKVGGASMSWWIVFAPTWTLTVVILGCALFVITTDWDQYHD